MAKQTQAARRRAEPTQTAQALAEKMSEYQRAFLISAILQAERSGDREAMRRYHRSADLLLYSAARMQKMPRAMSSWDDTGPLQAIAQLMPQLQNSEWFQHKMRQIKAAQR